MPRCSIHLTYDPISSPVLQGPQWHVNAIGCLHGHHVLCVRQFVFASSYPVCACLQLCGQGSEPNAQQQAQQASAAVTLQRCNSAADRLAQARKECEADLETDMRSFAAELLMSRAALSDKDWAKLRDFYGSHGIDLDSLVKQVGGWVHAWCMLMPILPGSSD